MCKTMSTSKGASTYSTPNISLARIRRFLTDSCSTRPFNNSFYKNTPPFTSSATWELHKVHCKRLDTLHYNHCTVIIIVLSNIIIKCSPLVAHGEDNTALSPSAAGHRVIFFKLKKTSKKITKNVDNVGFDPTTSRMLSVRSTN